MNVDILATDLKSNMSDIAKIKKWLELSSNARIIVRKKVTKKIVTGNRKNVSFFISDYKHEMEGSVRTEIGVKAEDERLKTIIFRDFLFYKLKELEKIVQLEKDIIVLVKKSKKMDLSKIYRKSIVDNFDINSLLNLKLDIQKNFSKQGYSKNENYKDGLQTQTTLGFKVRSKSEALIATLLTKYNIPFRYEWKVTLDDKTLYPDFVILLPNGSYIIWEHFGSLYDNDYSYKQHFKLQTYTKAGFYLGDNLIVTSEGPFGAFNAEAVEKIIVRLILPEYKTREPWIELLDVIKPNF